jgi:hypothetical protein
MTERDEQLQEQARRIADYRETHELGEPRDVDGTLVFEADPGALVFPLGGHVAIYPSPAMLPPELRP